MLNNKFALAACIAAATVTFSTGAFATTAWKEAHPRRAEVNARLHHQDHRINQEVRKGEITQAQARTLHREDRQVRHEERAMASQNGSHITKLEQRTLNQQENAISKQIGK